MRKNVGNVDKVARIVAGLGLLSLLFVLEAPKRYPGLVGIVPLVTVLVGGAPLHTTLGVNTCSVKH